jgi:hypothetical protein
LIARSFPSTTSTWICPRYGRVSVIHPPAPALNVRGGASVWPSTRSFGVSVSAPAGICSVTPFVSVTVYGTVLETLSVFFPSARSTRMSDVCVVPMVVPG